MNFAVIQLRGTTDDKQQMLCLFLLMQISYPYIVWNNVPMFHENRASSF